jgi:hypothetical protein
MTKGNQNGEVEEFGFDEEEFGFNKEEKFGFDEEEFRFNKEEKFGFLGAANDLFAELTEEKDPIKFDSGLKEFEDLFNNLDRDTALTFLQELNDKGQNKFHLLAQNFKPEILLILLGIELDKNPVKNDEIFKDLVNQEDSEKKVPLQVLSSKYEQLLSEINQEEKAALVKSYYVFFINCVAKGASIYDDVKSVVINTPGGKSLLDGFEKEGGRGLENKKVARGLNFDEESEENTNSLLNSDHWNTAFNIFSIYTESDEKSSKGIRNILGEVSKEVLKALLPNFPNILKSAAFKKDHNFIKLISNLYAYEEVPNFKVKETNPLRILFTKYSKEDRWFYQDVKETAETLIKTFGCDVNSKDRSGMSAMDEAKKKAGFFQNLFGKNPFVNGLKSLIKDIEEEKRLKKVDSVDSVESVKEMSFETGSINSQDFALFNPEAKVLQNQPDKTNSRV